ncbi:MAG TPA: winged helix-turn-helix domain-containing protein [Hyphomonadaceae bacterium]|nr:winged helix-turn-helix domain-containing protein [Hyphomonadaceae bacterium]
MEVRPATRELVFAGQREVLEPRVMAVLVRMAQAKGEVVTREDLTEACWDGRVVSDDAINRVISRIRRASDLTGGRDFTLETITKVGYRLVAGPAGGTAPPANPRPVQADEAKPPAGKRPVLLFGLVGAVVVMILAATWWSYGREPKWASADPSGSLTLAVLPFDNVGAGGGDEAIAFGMSREIRNTLSRVRGLRVVSDSSSFAVASEPLSATDMGKRLGADLLLDGSLAREGKTIRLSAELVDGWSGVNLWTGEKSGAADDLESLRQEMSAAVFEQLVARLGPKRLARTAEPKREDPRVYRLLLEAKQFSSSAVNARQRGQPDRALDDGDKASALVEQALEIDPRSASALVVKGQIIATSATRELSERGLYGPEAMAEASGYFRRALASDPDNVEALRALGEYYRRFEWRWNEARALLERALALDPNYYPAHRDYSYFLSTAGRCVDALEHARVLVEIEPESSWRSMAYPRILKCLGRFEESDAVYREVLAKDPTNLFALRELYLNMLVRRDVAALRELRVYVRDELWKGAPDPTIQGWLDWAEAAANALDGDTAPFVAILEASLRGGDGPPGAAVNVVNETRRRPDDMWMQALEFAVAGKPQRSIDLLKQAVEGGALYIPEAMPYGAFEFSPEVRADPRYQAIWKTDPRLVELVAMRLEAVKAGQMNGVLPNGQTVMPKPSQNTAG